MKRGGSVEQHNVADKSVLWPRYLLRENGGVGSASGMTSHHAPPAPVVYQAVAKYVDLCTLERGVALEAAMHSDDEDWVD